jgi:hypothetical protein
MQKRRLAPSAKFYENKTAKRKTQVREPKANLGHPWWRDTAGSEFFSGVVKRGWRDKSKRDSSTARADTSQERSRNAEAPSRAICEMLREQNRQKKDPGSGTKGEPGAPFVVDELGDDGLLAGGGATGGAGGVVAVASARY